MSVILIKNDIEKKDKYSFLKNKYDNEKKTYVLGVRTIIISIGILIGIFGGQVINSMYSSDEDPAKIIMLIVYIICLLTLVLWTDSIEFSRRYGSILISNKWNVNKVRNGIMSDTDFEVKIEYVLNIGKETVTITKEQYKKLSNASDLNLMIVDIGEFN